MRSEGASALEVRFSDDSGPKALVAVALYGTAKAAPYVQRVFPQLVKPPFIQGFFQPGKPDLCIVLASFSTALCSFSRTPRGSFRVYYACACRWLYGLPFSLCSRAFAWLR